MSFDSPYKYTGRSQNDFNGRCLGKTSVTIYGEDIVKELDMLNFDMGAGVGRGYRYYKGRHSHGL